MKRNIPNLMLILLSGVLSTALTIFVFINSFEIVTQIDIPTVKALTTLDSSALSSIVLESEGRDYKLERLSISSTGDRLSLSPAIVRNEKVYQLANKGHYINFNYHPIYNVGDIFIHTKKSWRTIHDLNNLRNGEYITVSTTSEKITYKVLDIVQKPSDESFIFSDNYNTPILLFALFDDDENLVTYVKSIAVAVEKT